MNESGARQNAARHVDDGFDHVSKASLRHCLQLRSCDAIAYDAWIGRAHRCLNLAAGSWTQPARIAGGTASSPGPVGSTWHPMPCTTTSLPRDPESPA